MAGLLSIAAAVTALDTGLQMIRTHSILPRADEWPSLSLFDQMLQHGHAFTLTFKAHNEHRLFFPRIVLFSDYLFSGGYGVFDKAIIHITQGLESALFAWLAGRVGAGVAARTALGAVATVLMFSLQQNENFIWAFQVQFVGVFACASLCCTLFAHGLPSGPGSRGERRVFAFTAGYLGTFVPFGEASQIGLGACGLAATTGIVTRAALKGEREAVRLVLLGIALFAAGSALVTAVGRSNFGMNGINASRCTTGAAVFWAATILDVWSLSRTLRAGVVGRGLACLVSAVLLEASFAGQTARAAEMEHRAVQYDSMGDALLLGLYDVPRSRSSRNPSMKCAGRNPLSGGSICPSSGPVRPICWASRSATSECRLGSPSCAMAISPRRSPSLLSASMASRSRGSRACVRGWGVRGASKSWAAMGGWSASPTPASATDGGSVMLALRSMPIFRLGRCPTPAAPVASARLARPRASDTVSGRSSRGRVTSPRGG